MDSDRSVKRRPLVSTSDDNHHRLSPDCYPHEHKTRAGAYRGTIVHSLELGVVQLILDGLIIVNASGRIAACYDLDNLPDDVTLSAEELVESFEANLTDLRGKLILPGFVDGHAHAPQYAFTGTGMDLPLLQWLEKYTFPCESKFQDVAFARDVYTKAVTRHLRSGTTTCSYFATIHVDACKVLVDVVRRAGQRAYVGKVSMDRNSPDYLIETTEDAMRDAELFAKFVLSTNTEAGAEAGGSGEGIASKMKQLQLKDGAEAGSVVGATGTQAPTDALPTPLVTPVLTPRFVPSCTAQLMQKLGDISEEYSLPVQSHLSESPGEIAWVRELHPECDTYMGVYDRYGLLHERSYFAHCVHCTGEERELMSLKGGAVIHCPSSNFMLGSGVANVKRYIRDGCKVGLGTDVAGGYSSSILDCLRQALIASRVCSFGHGLEPGEAACDALTFQEGFHLATQGGAEALGLGHLVGNFTPGKEFDALVVDVRSIKQLDPSGVAQQVPNAPQAGGGGVAAAPETTPEHASAPFHMFPGQGMQEAFEKFLFLGDDRNIAQVYVGGVRVV
eukprot:TRINITY_DN16187_c0_g1_i1.p1 TRINITY_DN16187_c0_g1~~TRINITY_DN16187_c0_g1_i1.p1  ORF type:complete len:560 (-),score=154.09 TRINITY_DN16187_c0_g1_i1:594-2273(-)